MCGIVGEYAHRSEKACPRRLLDMAGELRHRGPDGCGLYLDRRFGMANTRLAIVDVHGGDQPIGNETGRYWAMQNGEIYNAPELRAELESLGHCFRTTCDTEVLVHGYEQWGADCLARLNGAFAFAVWDIEREELFLARDRLGIRPLFLADYNGCLLFASECKALLRHPRAVRRICPVGLTDTLALWSCTPDYSCFAGIRELPPGHYLTLDALGSLRQQRWWDLNFGESERTGRIVGDESPRQLRELLQDAVRIRLRADVQVGAYLSGGLDSSAIVAMAEQSASHKLQSFALSFADPRFDEREFQQRAARALETNLATFEIDGPQIAASLPNVVRMTEKPLLRTAPAPLLSLSKAVSDFGLKVVLTGEGADEIFAGYNIFRENKIRRYWARCPGSEQRPRLLHRIYPYLGQELKRSRGFWQSFFGRGLNETTDPLYSHHIRMSNAERLLTLLDADVVRQAAQSGSSQERLQARLPSDFGRYTPLGKAQYLEITGFMQGYLLHSQGDRMLMANGIEGRFPFLDHRVVEFATRLPDRMRLHGLREKHVLRKAVQPLLPEAIVRRTKQPYRAPILSAILGTNKSDDLVDLLSPTEVRSTGLFDSRRVERLVEKCRRRVDEGVSETDEMALVAVLTTVLLDRQLIHASDNPPPSVPGKTVVGRRLAKRPTFWEPAA